ncbi:MAG: methyltransferase domain-containing protein [Chloroflexi bacterium]|nr:methyltransferase domain-containing protein [Chloroflexota bacterium]
MAASETWYEDDSFWQIWGPILFDKKRIANAVTEVDQLIKLANLPAGAHVLDLCCGVGRHSLELARRGFRVTGVDRTSEYLAQARELAKTEGLDIELIHQDMREFCRPEGFDAAINLFTSFGYFQDEGENRKVAENLFRSLKSGGVLIMDMSGKEVIARNFRERDWSERDDAFHLEENRVLSDWERIESRWIVFRDNKRYEGGNNVRLYAGSELRALLTGCGFAPVNIYGSFEGMPYDQTARRLVAVARKE